MQFLPEGRPNSENLHLPAAIYHAPSPVSSAARGLSGRIARVRHGGFATVLRRARDCDGKSLLARVVHLQFVSAQRMVQPASPGMKAMILVMANPRVTPRGL